MTLSNQSNEEAVSVKRQVVRMYSNQSKHDTINRDIAIETPVSIEFNGVGYAVMMSTPRDLTDFVTGFAITEKLIERAEQLGSIDAHAHEKGWIVRANLPTDKTEPIFERARTRIGDSSCGLCGVENLDLIDRPLPIVAKHDPIENEHIFRALKDLEKHQPINYATGGVHAAAWVNEYGKIQFVREDVGRHNALDKLIGAMANKDRQMNKGFVLTTSRCSYEILEKSAIAGVTTLVTISVPTSMAIQRAKSCRLSLISLARPDSLLRC